MLPEVRKGKAEKLDSFKNHAILVPTYAARSYRTSGTRGRKASTQMTCSEPIHFLYILMIRQVDPVRVLRGIGYIRGNLSRTGKDRPFNTWVSVLRAQNVHGFRAVGVACLLWQIFLQKLYYNHSRAIVTTLWRYNKRKSPSFMRRISGPALRRRQVIRC